MYYINTPPPGSIRAQYAPSYTTHPLSPMAPILPPETPALRESIIKQIEYYFRYFMLVIVMWTSSGD